MSDKLAVRKDKGTRVMKAVKEDGTTVLIVAGTYVAYSMIPVVGWLAGAAGLGWLAVRAVKRGLSDD